MSEQRSVWIKDKVSVDINSDLTKAFVVLFLCFIATSQCASEARLKEANELRKQQLEVAKKQYQLDSLRYYAPVRQK